AFYQYALATQRGATHFGHVVVMKKLGLTVVPVDLHARPIGSDDRALIRRAVMPGHAVAEFQLFGLGGCHDGILRRNLSSLWRGSNDKLSSKRDLRFYGIRDEALCFDAFHDCAGTFEFGLVFEGYARSNHNFCDAVLAFDIFEQAF